MQKKLAMVAGAIVAFIGIFIAFVATKPDTFSVSRSASVNAPPDRIFPLINDFHKWKSWSPYERKDPNMKRTYSGTEQGKGTIYEWVGNDDVGSGRMEILDTKPPNLVTIKLDFIKPFEGHNTAEFKMEPAGDATNVSWTIRGPVPFTAKIFHVIFDMDKMIGDDFVVGLANIKLLAEKPAGDPESVFKRLGVEPAGTSRDATDSSYSKMDSPEAAK